jgi:hypothetical protein
MNTAKYKADQLIRKMTIDFSIELEQSKLCAIVAVDEILDFITKYDNHWLDYTYWQEVKDELEDL